MKFRFVFLFAVSSLGACMPAAEPETPPPVAPKKRPPLAPAPSNMPEIIYASSTFTNAFEARPAMTKW